MTASRPGYSDTGPSGLVNRWTGHTRSGSEHAADGGLSNSLLATIAVPGHLDLDGRTNALDLLILANYLAGNVQPETAPFNALLSAANLNGDSVVNVVDVVILANHLAGNIPCLRSR